MDKLSRRFCPLQAIFSWSSWWQYLGRGSKAPTFCWDSFFPVAFGKLQLRCLQSGNFLQFLPLLQGLAKVKDDETIEKSLHSTPKHQQPPPTIMSMLSITNIADYITMIGWCISAIAWCISPTGLCRDAIIMVILKKLYNLLALVVMKHLHHLLVPWFIIHSFIICLHKLCRDDLGSLRLRGLRGGQTGGGSFQKSHPTSGRGAKTSGGRPSWTKWAAGGGNWSWKLENARKQCGQCKDKHMEKTNVEKTEYMNKKLTSQIHVDVLLHSLAETWRVQNFKATQLQDGCANACATPCQTINWTSIQSITIPHLQKALKRNDMNQFMLRIKGLVHLWNPKVWIHVPPKLI